MASSASPFQIEDQTDQDFFDKLVNDEFDGSQPKPEEITRKFSSLSLGDVSASLDDSGEPEIADKAESTEKVDALKPDEAPKENLLVSDGSLSLETSGLFDSNKVDADSQGLETAKTDGSKGTSVKEVQWSAFSVDTSQEFEKVAGFEPYSDFLTQNSEGFVEKPVENFSSNVGSTEQQDNQFYGSTTEQTADGNDPQYWEHLYPGWKFDASTGQWYQVDNYDTTTDSQLNNSNVASIESVSQSSGVSYLQQSSQSVLETIAEECTVSSSVSNWNKASEGSMEYPPNMVFDPQYPEWYYDTNTQQWYTLESYTQGLANSSNAVLEQLSENVNASAGLISDQNHSFYSDVGQSKQHCAQGEGNREFGQAWDASIYSQQNSLYSNISQTAHHASQSQGSQGFGQNWDASISNHNQTNSLYNNTSQSEQMNSQGWGNHEFGQNKSVSMSKLAEQNSLYSNITAATHHNTRSQGSQDFGQNWNASMGNYAQKNSLYSNASHSEQQSNQGQGIQGFEGNWDASRSLYAQPSMWQPQPVGSSTHTTGFSGNQQTRSSYGSIAGSQTIQETGFKAFEPLVSQNYDIKNRVTGFQSFAPKESMYNSNQPKVEQTLQSHLSNSYYGDQNPVNYPHQSFQGSNASQLSYTPNDGRSSAGRPPHALVAFGFGGKLIVMKNVNSFGSSLGYGNQVKYVASKI